MSKPLFIGLGTLVLAVGMAPTPGAQADSWWEAGAGAVFLNRDASYSGAFVEDTGHNEVLGESAVATGFHSGINVDVMRHATGTHSLHARFFAIDDWTVNDSATTANGAWLYDSVTLGEGTITTVNSTFASDLYSGELNLVHQHNDWLDVMLGVRWLSIDENINISFFRGATDYSDYDGFVENDLYGFQGGAGVNFYDHGGPFTLDGLFKAGVFGNNASYDGVYQNGVSAQINNTTTKLAFVGEIGIVGKLLVSDHVSMSAGYQLLWVDGIALLGEQLETADWATLNGGNASGHAFYHGAVVNVTMLLP